MKKPFSFLGSMIFIAILVFPGACRDNGLKKTSPKITKGVLDLRSWDFGRDGVVSLSGAWRFHWKTHLAPENVPGPAASDSSGFIEVPGAWNGRNQNGEKISGDGFATYGLKILRRPQREHLAFKLLDMATAFRIYVDGRLLVSSGHPGQSADTTTPLFSPGIAEFETDSDRIDILVHVSNFHHRQGGMWESIQLGGAAEVKALRERRLVVGFLLLGSILIMGLYHMGLNWARRNDTSSLYFGVFCLLLGTRFLFSGERYGLRLFPGLGYEWTIKIVYLSFYACVPVFAMYMKSLFPRELSGKVIFAAQVMGLVFSGLVLISTARVYTVTMPWFQFFTLLLLLYGTWAVIQSALRKRSGARVFFFGFLVLFFTTANDILYTRQMIETGHLFQIGFFVFIFSQAYIISNRFSAAFSTIEKQGRDLMRANTAYKKEIRQREHTEAKIVESEKKYRELFEGGSDLLCIHDLTGNLMETNLHFKKGYGWTRDDLDGLNIREMLPDRFKAKFDQYLARIMANGSDEGLMNGYTKSGETVVLEYRNRIITDDNGVPAAVQGAARDVTERVRAEKALRESEEKYKEIVQYAPSGIYEFDMERLRFISVNDVMCQYSGYTEAEFLALDAFEILSEESKETLNNLIEEVFSNKPSELSAEYRLRGKDGREFWVLSNARFFYENGLPKRAMAVVHDLTEIRRAEEERRQLEIKLQNAKKLESLGTLAGGVAHDLNNILSGVVSYPDLLLLDLEKESPLRAPLMTIKRSGEKAAEIVQDLLTLARRGVETRKVVSLNRIVHDFLESPEYDKIRVAHDRLRVETDMSENVLNIVGSEVHIFKTLMNLVANAAESMPAGGTVIISTASCYLDRTHSGFEPIPEGEYIALRITDTGIGMARSDLEQIFEPFYTKKAMGRSGTGLGMSVVWGTVKDHGGFVDIVTEEGSGTTFALYFPVTRLEQEMLESVYIEDYLGKGESILVIDDSKEQRELAERMMQRLGYTVHTAASGEVSVEMIKQNAYDLLILDMIMPPGMNGLQTYREILRYVPDQKAVIASGFAATDMVRETQRLGAGGYVKKPYTLEKIGLAVRSELDRRR